MDITHPNLAERRHFERSVLPLTRSLRGAALRLSRSSAEADDLVQETVLKAWRFWSRYEERESCRAWLHRILANTFVTERRKRRREREVLVRASAEQEDRGQEARAWQPRVLRDSMDQRLAGSLAALPDDQRRVLWLVDVDERSYHEAATALRVPLGTVMSRLHRARRALRAELWDTATALDAGTSTAHIPCLI